MNLAGIPKLSPREKFQLMEALGEDMRHDANESEIPPDHLELLEERWVRVQSGQSALLEWDEVKDSIGKP